VLQAPQFDVVLMTYHCQQ